MLLEQLVLLLVCVVVATQAKCVIDSSVTGSERQKQETILQVLDPIMGQRSEQLMDQKGNTYNFVVCEDVDKTHRNVSIIQTDTTERKFVLGYNNKTLASRNRDWLMVTFLGGDKFEQACNKTMMQSHILFICDHHQNKVEIHTLNDYQQTLSCALMFIVRHSCVCAVSKEGLGAGAIFFILILVAFGAYFTFGFFYLRLVRGAKGVEQIPNRVFWFKIGNMLADGCGAVFRCDRYCGGGSATSSYGGYSPIDERLAQDLQDTDRDTSLLSP